MAAHSPVTRILVVDDDEDALLIARRLVRHVLPDAEVVTLDTYQGGLAALLHGGQSDGLIADCCLPDGNGLDLRDRAVQLGIPHVIAVSGLVAVSARALRCAYPKHQLEPEIRREWAV